MKSEEVQQKYHDDIDLMHQYSHEHEENMWQIEEEMKATIQEWTESEEEIACIQDLWTTEARKNEKISLQLWYKRLEFLAKKKKEEEETENIRFINDEQEEDMKKKSYLKRNRFRVRRNYRRPATRSSNNDKGQVVQVRRSRLYSDRHTQRYHDNWRLGLNDSTGDHDV